MAYDEMFEAQNLPREHYQPLQRTLLGLAPQELRKSQQAADLTFLQEGITFTVYGSKEGIDRQPQRDGFVRLRRFVPLTAAGGLR